MVFAKYILDCGLIVYAVCYAAIKFVYEADIMYGLLICASFRLTYYHNKRGTKYF